LAPITSDLAPTSSSFLLYTDFRLSPALASASRCPFQLGNIVSGVFAPVLAKHTRNLSVVDILAVGVDCMQRNFEPMRKQVESAKLVIYRADERALPS